MILSDCPWSYSDKGGKRGADHHYATLSMRDLMLLRVGDLAAENCAHFLWVTGPFMLNGIRLLQNWGFDYKGVVFVWVKTNSKSGGLFTGMGHYSRSNCEFVLLGLKGKLERKSASVHSVVMSPMIRHSAKPPEVRNRIVDLFGDIPRVEIFARDKCPGWDQTGLELDEKDIRDYIEEAAPARSGLSVLKKRT